MSAPPEAPEGSPPEAPPRLSGVVVHWHDEAHLAALAAAWPRDPRFELIVVDNGSEGRLPPEGTESTESTGSAGAIRVIRPGRNLGFAGGANAGIAAARGRILLLLNPDAAPEPGALDRLLEGFAAHPGAAGLAPRLEGPGGEPQWAWQLRRLPSPARLLLHALPLAPDGTAPRAEPAPGSPVEQPAAAALALTREALEAVGGLDDGFFPAWFEDVDLARRLGDRGLPVLYWPAARFRHALGSTVPRLGYGPFLSIYYRNLARYLAKHHGRGWALAARAALVPGALLRLAALLARTPKRAGSRREAAAGLVGLLIDALSGWRGAR